MTEDITPVKIIVQALEHMYELFPHVDKKNIQPFIENNNPIGVYIYKTKGQSNFKTKLLLSTEGNELTRRFFNIFHNSGHSVYSSHLNAWLLVLHHEFGHIDINNKCIAKGLDPRDQRFQAMEAGVHECRFWNSLAAMDSAVESFCDLQMLFFARKRFPNLFNDISMAIVEFREQQSLTVPPKYDEYLTASTLKQYLIDSGDMAAGEAIFESFKEHMGNNHVIENSMTRAWQILRDMLFKKHDDEKPLNKINNFSIRMNLRREGQKEKTRAASDEKKPFKPGT